MKRVLNLLSLLVILLMTSCQKEFDALNGRIDDLEVKMSKLEDLCSQMNNDISSLQTLVAAMENRESVTDIIPIKEGKEEIGYTIQFSSGKTITIHHGKNGKDGAPGKTPVIGVKKDKDGLYYWTLDDQWLSDEEGQKVRATGKDGLNGQEGDPGKDGVSPQLKIEADGFWYLSTDGGKTWSKLYAAQGPKGDPGEDGEKGDSMFQSVTFDEEFVYVTLADGTRLSVVRHHPEDDLSIALETKELTTVVAGKDYVVHYSLTGSTKNVFVRAIAENNWKAKAVAIDSIKGTINITAPDPLMDGEVLVFASNGTNKTVMAAIHCWKGKITVNHNTVDLPAAGGGKAIAVMTNLDYDVVIPTEAQTWLRVAETRAEMRNETLTFSIRENATNLVRKATVTLVTETEKEVVQSMVFTQAAADSQTKADFTVTAGSLEQMLKDRYGDYTTLTELKLDGTMDVEDFRIVRECMPNLKSLDLSGIELTSLPDGVLGADPNMKIDTLILPRKLTTIPARSFANGCFKHIQMYDAVTSIGEFAFYNCRDLLSVHLPAGLSAISNSCFEECRSLKELTFPAPCKIRSIGERAFYHIRDLENIEIPASVETIGAYAFRAYTGWSYGSEDYYSKLQKLTFLPGSELKSIGNYAFKAHNTLSAVQLPKSVVSIGHGAFQDCLHVTSFTFETGSALKELKGQALSNIDITSLTIPEGVCEISDSLCYNNNQLQSLHLHKGIKRIGHNAFDRCAQLRSTFFEECTSLEEIGKWGFYGCKSFQNLVLPTTIRILDSNVFDGCSNLISCTIPSNVTKLTGTFANCSKLQSIVIPAGVDTIGAYTFANCTSLKTLKRNGVALRVIGQNAFENCTSLVSDVIMEGDPLNSIEAAAFKNCSAMNVDIVLPSSLNSIGASCFQYSGIRSLSYPARFISTGNICEGCKQLTTVTLPSALTAINDNAFKNCISLKTINFPETLEKIGYRAFENCPLEGDFVLSSSFTQLGSCAFLNCKQIQSVSMQACSNLHVIPSSTFSGCSQLQAVHLPDQISEIQSSAFEYCGQLKQLVLNNSLRYVGDYAFNKCHSLDVVLPESVTSIGTGALKSTSTKSVTFPSSMSFIPESVCGDCASLTSVTLSSSTRQISKYAFMDCINLKSVTFPESLTDIGQSSFQNTGLIHVSIPSGVKTIYSSAFSGSAKLASVDFSKAAGLTQIRDYAFAGTALVNVTLPSNLTSMLSGVFQNCAKLASIVLPAGITKICDYTFQNCYSLKTIDASLCTSMTEAGYYGTTYSNVSLDVFKLGTEVPPTLNYNFGSTATLQVPATAIEAYKAHGYWGTFGTIEALP